ncbi:hypothetical protein GF351_04740 [Candidatus Woesearchaeota archaeon]|nr:hypothetical protein [Candidatus Woesearchaeota archaeon]
MAAKGGSKHKYTDRIYIEAAQMRVKNRDFFHLKNLYITLHEWLCEEGWIPENGKDINFPEIYYLHRDHPKTGTEVWLFWRPEKEINSYYKYRLDIDWHCILIREAEVMHEGQKFKTNWGEVEIKIWAREELDYSWTWRNHWFLKHIHDLFRRRIFKTSTEVHKLELYREAYRFHEAIKTYLKLKTYLPEPELQEFFPQLGLGTPK